VTETLKSARRPALLRTLLVIAVSAVASPVTSAGTFASAHGPTGTIAVGTGQYIFAVDASSGGGHALGTGDYPAFSRTGRLAFTLNGVWVAGWNGRGRRHIVPRFAEYITYATPAWSPDGRRLAYIRVDNGHETSELWVVRADGSALHGLSIVHAAQSPSWSPDGRWIAYVGDGGLSEVLADGSGKRLLLRRDVSSPTWSPDGSRLAYVERRGGTVSTSLLDVRTGAIHVVEHHRGSPGPIAWSPDARWLAYTTERPDAGGAFVEIRAVGLAGGDRRVVARLFVQHLDGLSWRR
jgi:dipeptidyl aminopeptidase/acylaminoacyl peptidase